MANWTVSASDGGTLDIRTGVTGRASKMGHRLTIDVTDWSVTVDESNGAPTSVAVRAAVASLEVVGGEGGVTPMFGPEKMLARSNALNTLEAKKFPDIRYDATDIAATDSGYRLTGNLQIHGVTREHVVDLAVSRHGDTTHVSCESSVTQTAFGVKPYSQLMGSMKVVDDVTVTFEADLAR